jgi:hypothetical protein
VSRVIIQGVGFVLTSGALVALLWSLFGSDFCRAAVRPAALVVTRVVWASSAGLDSVL